jgi:hypothetical protein
MQSSTIHWAVHLNNNPRRLATVNSCQVCRNPRVLPAARSEVMLGRPHCEMHKSILEAVPKDVVTIARTIKPFYNRYCTFSVWTQITV